MSDGVTKYQFETTDGQVVQFESTRSDLTEADVPGIMAEMGGGQRPSGPSQMKAAARGAGLGLAGDTAALFGLADIGRKAVTGQLAADAVFGKGPFSDLFSNVEAAEQAVEPYLPDAQPGYETTEEVSKWVGPGVAVGGVGKLAGLVGKAPRLAKALQFFWGPVEDLGGYLGSKAAESIGVDSSAAQLLFSLGGSSAANVAKQGVVGAARGAKRATVGYSPDEVRELAADVFQTSTDIDEKKLAQVIVESSDEELDVFRRELASRRTTAEVTEDAGAAKLEKTLGSEGEFSSRYLKHEAKRSKIRERQLDTTTTAPRGVEPLEVAGQAIEKAEDYKTFIEKAENKAWEKVPKNKVVSIGEQQDKVLDFEIANPELDHVPAPVRRLLEEFTDTQKGTTRTSGELQKLRSRALKLKRQADKAVTTTENLTKEDTVRALDVLQEQVLDAMDTQLGKASDYSRARTITKGKAEIFGGKTLGAQLTSGTAESYDILQKVLKKGDAKSLRELRRATADNPGLMADVKRVFLENDAFRKGGELQPEQFSKYVKQNKSKLSEIFEPEHIRDMEAIAQDLQSQAKVTATARKINSLSEALKGKKTIAQAIEQSAAFPLIWRINPLAGLALKVGFDVTKVSKRQLKEDVMEMLFQASMEPKMAKQLLETPTKAKTTSVLGDLLKFYSRGSVIGIGAGQDTEFENEGMEVAPPVAPIDVEPPAAELPIKKKSNMREAPPKLRSLIEEVAFQHGMDPDLVQATIEQESDYDPLAVGPKTKYGHAVGLMQLLPSTAKWQAGRIGKKDFDLKNSRDNLELGVSYLKYLLDKFGDEHTALTAYHTGEGNVQKGKIGPVGKKYANQVLNRMKG